MAPSARALPGGGGLTGAVLAAYAVLVGGPQLITLFLVHLVMSNMPFRQLDSVNWKSFVKCMGWVCWFKM